MINSLKTLVSSANIPFISGGGNSHVSNHLQHRPRMATVALLLLTFSFFNITSAWALIGPYCGTDVSLLVGGPTVKMSFVKTGTNDYKIVIVSSSNKILSVNGHAHISSNNAYHYGAAGNYSISVDGYTATIPFSSTTAPKLYNDIFVSFETIGEKKTGIFNEQDIDWSTSCDVDGGKLYFVKPQGWSWTPPLYAYMWNGGSNNGWPGVVMSPNEQVTLEKCTADIYEWNYSSLYNTLQLHETNDNDNTRKKLDGISIPGKNMYYVPSIMSDATSVTNWKWCASQGVNLRIGDDANNYYTDDPSHKFAFAQGSGHTLTTTVTLAGNTVYYFKLEQTQEDKWYTYHDASNTAGEGQMTSSNCTDWDMAYNRDDPATKILTTEPGEYTFTYDYTSDRLSVTYPSGMATSTACSGISDEVIEPATPFYYAYDFSTLPNGDVQIQFEWLGDGEPVNIYFHDYTSGSMAESSMTRSGKVGKKTITGKSTGDILIFGCKFDKSGVYRTRRFVYKVGYNCGEAECGESGNIAAGKLAKAGYSRMYDAGRGGRNEVEQPQMALDGKMDTHFIAWGADGADKDAYRWWAVDLGAEYNLDNVKIYWQEEGRSSANYILQTRSDLSADFENDAAYSNSGWTTIKTVTEKQAIGSANSYDVKGQGRYLRLVANDRINISISEFEVYVSGCVSDDSNPPTMGSATYVSNNDGNTGVILELKANDSEGEVSRFRLDEEGGGSTFVDTDGSHRATLDGIASGSHTYHVYAIDGAGNVSANYVELSFCFVNSSVNLALHATTSAGFTEGDVATTANAVDGDNDTQWNGTGATAGTDEWFMVDLGRTYDLREVKILWSKTGGEDDGGTYPVNYKLQGSNNGTDFYTFAHYSSKTETGQWLDYTTTDPLPARYVRVWVDQHSSYAMGIRELEVYSKDECFVEQEPVITFAEITNLTPSGVTVSCDAYANTTNMAGMRFYYELTNTGTGLTTPGTLAHTDGSITVTGLEPNINYSLKIYAEITSSSARSANYKELTFNLTYSSLHYLTEETECNWQAGLYNTEWQFAFTDRYSPTEVDKGGAPLRILEYTHHTISNHVDTDPPTIQYKLYEAGYGGIWTSGGNLFFRNPKGKPLKMYALGTEKFVCNLDELYVSGDAVGGWWTENNNPSSATADNYQMHYDDETGLFSWTGDVVPGTGKYFKIVIRDIRSVDATADTWAYNRIMQANATYDREWTRATLYFDMSTWTWWWESAMAGCVREGGPGVHNTDNGGQEFTDGYKLNSYVVTEDGKRYFVVEAEPLDAELNNAILHIYKDESAAVTEVGKDGDAKTYKVGSTTHTYYRFKKLVSDIPGAINGIIRYYVKFEGPDGIIRNTKYHYYDLPHNECAPDTWIIYHHGQAPEVGDRETFDGGRIVQPIEYRRKFDLDTWYSLYLPFDVTAVKVISGGTYYDLLPYYRTDGGTLKGKQYIIRKAKPVENMPIVNVENRLPSESPNGWFDPSESEYETFLPQRNTPYIIQFHNKYYEDKWIAFFGKWYSTIETKFSENAAPTNDEVVNIYGNNTMKNQSLKGQCYQLNYDEYDSYAWTRFDNVTLYPFECYILANETTTAKYRVLRRGAAEDTPTGMEDVYEESGDIRVYTIAGQYLCTLHNMSPDEAGQHLQSRLTEGVYILRTPALSYKLIIGGL